MEKDTAKSLPSIRLIIWVVISNIRHCFHLVSRQLEIYRVFSHDVTAAILVSQNKETAAMLVSQTNPVGVELFSYAHAFFCFNNFA